MKVSLIWPCLFSLASAWPLEPLPERTLSTATATDRPSPVHRRAIEPTADGMIGVTPWKDVKTGGSFNPIVTHYVDNSGKWKGANSKYITQVKTLTDDGKTTTTTVSAPMAAMSGPADSMNILISPKLRDELVDIAKKVSPCSGKKRDALCGLGEFVSRVDSATSSAIEEARAAMKTVNFASSGTMEGAKNLLELLEVSGNAELAKSVAVGAGVTVAVIPLYQLFQEQTMPFRYSYQNAPKNKFAQASPPTKESNDDDNDDDDDDKCPKDAPTGDQAPWCDDCGGKPKDKVCTKGKYEHCKCVVPTYGSTLQWPDGWQQEWKDLWEKATSSKGQLLDDQKPKVNCSNNYGDAISMEKSFLEKLADKFCSGDKHEAVLDSSDIGSNQDNGSPVAFKYNPGKGCQATCKQAFQALFNECEGTNSHTVQAKGSATVKKCGASYEYQISKKLSPDCNIDNASRVPANVFQSAPIWKDFCDQLNGGDEKNDDNRWMVTDIDGHKPTLLKRDLEARTPPPNPDSYRNYNFFLKFKANNQGICRASCADAYKEIAQGQCGRGGSQQNTMARRASVDVGCGTYSYQITGMTALEKGETHCFQGNQFPDHDSLGDRIDGKHLLRQSCGLYEDVTMSPKHSLRDYPMWADTRTTTGMFWRRNCKLEDEEQKQSMLHPLGKDKSPSCSEALQAVADRCNDHGGYKDYGCVRYVVIPVTNGKKHLRREDWY